MDTEVAVLVVGAGPTGLLLAAELCRRGVDCRVIDANPEPLHWDRATVVHPRSLEIFESLGIVEPLLSAGVKQRFARLHSAGRVLGEIDLALCGSRYPFNIGVSEEVTESILTEYLEQHGGTIVRATRLVGLKDAGDHAVASIERDGVTEQVSARWIVGCDGVRSATRTLSGIEMIGNDHSETWAVFDATLPGWSDSYEGNYGYLDEIPVILTALPGRRWRVYLRPSGAESDLLADASTTIGRYLPAIRFADTSHPARFHCHSKIAARYRSGRVILAGDAAHVCSPSQGHGMNSGLQDAFNLAWKLALVCQDRCAEALLDSYEPERRPVAETITSSGDAFERAQELTDQEARNARDEELRAVFANPKSRHHESIAEAELDIAYTNSPIVMGDRHEALSPGQRLPDTIEVRHPNGEVGLLHELAHRIGHTALVIGGVGARGEELARLDGAIRTRGGKSLIGAVFLLTAQSGGQSPSARLSPAAVERLGVGEKTLLVIRPDGRVGLRADREHLEALAAYEALLSCGGGWLGP